MPISYSSPPPAPSGMPTPSLRVLREELQEDTIQSIIAYAERLTGAKNSLDLVRDFNAPIDGSSNATDAWAEALAELSSGSSYKTLIVPPYTYNIDTPLVLHGSATKGVSILGQGGPVFTGPRLKYVGTETTSPLFKFLGVCKSRFDNLAFDANSLADFAALLISDQPAGGSGSFYNTFLMCQFLNARGTNTDSGCLAFGSPGTGYQVSETDFHSCQIAGNGSTTKNGVLQRDNGNTKNFRFWGGASSYCATPFNFATCSGSYVLNGIFCGAFTDSAIKGGPNGFFDITSVEVETSGSDQARFLNGSASSNAMSATITNCDVNVKAPNDDFVVRWYGGLVINGGQFWNSRQGAQTNIPKIAIAAQASIGATGPGSVRSSGVYYANCPAGYAPFYDDGGTALLGTDGSRNNQSSIESMYDYGGLFGSGTLNRLINVRGSYIQESPLEARNGSKAFTYSGRNTGSTTRYDYTYSDFQTAALFKDLDLFEPKDGEGIRRVRVKVTTAFGNPAGTWGGTLLFRIGDTVGGNEIMADQDGKTVAVYNDDPAHFGTAYATAMGAKGVYTQTSVGRFKMRLTSSVGNLSTLTAGAVTVWIEHWQLP